MSAWWRRVEVDTRRGNHRSFRSLVYVPAILFGLYLYGFAAYYGFGGTPVAIYIVQYGLIALVVGAPICWGLARSTEGRDRWTFAYLASYLCFILSVYVLASLSE